MQRNGEKDIKKNRLKPWLKQYWCLPGKPSAPYVCAMEDVLEVYKRPYDPAYPQVCMDEVSKQLVGEVHEPLPTKPGLPRRIDTQYVRNGTANIFILFEPLVGCRQIKVTDHRTKIDFSYLMKDLVDIHYPQASKIVLVLDNLNTHDKAALYETFEPKEAKRIADKLEIHYTPKHGSWLNIAECELSVLSRQCLNQRIPDKESLEMEVASWNTYRNHQAKGVDWQFTVEKARVKLKSLYPTILSR